MDAVNQYSQLTYPIGHTLFFEFHGSEDGIAEQTTQVATLVRENGGSELEWSTKQEEKNALRQAQHDAYYAARALRPGAEGWPTDVCVPISRLADCLIQTREDTDKHGVLAPIEGHVSDGNFHLLLLAKPGDESDLKMAEAINDRLIKGALEMGGTCTGEHGIGYGKQKYMYLEHDKSLFVIRLIKTALDPNNIMNPAKVIPDLTK